MRFYTANTGAFMITKDVEKFLESLEDYGYKVVKKTTEDSILIELYDFDTRLATGVIKYGTLDVYTFDTPKTKESIEKLWIDALYISK